MIIIIPAVFKNQRDRIISYYLLTRTRTRLVFSGWGQCFSGLYRKRVHVLLELGVLLLCKIKLH